MATAALAAESAIKTMKLYNNIDRVTNEMKNRGLLGLERKLDAAELVPFTCLNYSGSAGCHRAIDFMKLEKTSNLLDVGCGVGGPSLLIAETTGCRITAVDLQEDVLENLKVMSGLCGLSAQISPVRANIVNVVPSEQFDGMIAMLTILHIPLDQRDSIFKNIFACLNPGAGIYLEDYFRKGDFCEAEVASLENDVYCSELPTAQEYATTLQDCGFEAVNVEDRTEEWGGFVAERFGMFKANREAYIQTHNEETFTSMEFFYSATDTLFKGGNLGAGSIYARKPMV
ncbi:S-adenosyl-L-methionine-dependent methyltransferase [Ochromonadaceae sp. CCMP2298]|nr:S-adenosyl-L-methionine-dependent methyltransferase [Ochromonadaceae sp. CCMP2298]